MKIFSKLFLFLAAFSLSSLISCTDEEGEGGKAKISGVVYKVVDDGNIAKTETGFSFVRDTIIASEVDVYLIYGADQNAVYDDKTKTSHNGKFEFDYLRAGDYSIFAYNDNDSYEMRSVHCSKTGTAEVEPMYILDGKNSAKCGVAGDVVIRYAATTRDYVSGVAVRVYLRKFGEMSVSDTRSDDNGNYYFARLEPETKYIVWVEEEQIKNGKVVANADTIMTGKSGDIVISDTLKAMVY